MFTAKGNQKLLLEDIALWFDTAAPRPASRNRPRCRMGASSSAPSGPRQLNAHVHFPGVGQAFMLRRSRQNTPAIETVYGVTSHTPDTAHAQRLLRLNRGHWCIDTIAAWDRTAAVSAPASAPRTPPGCAASITLVKARGLEVAPTVRRLARNVRAVLDLLKMTRNTHPRRPVAR